SRPAARPLTLAVTDRRAPAPSITLSHTTRSPTWSRGSRAPHTPADTTRGQSEADRRAGQRSFRRPAAMPTGATPPTPPGANGRGPPPTGGNGREGSGGRESARARPRVSSSTAVRTRIATKPV